MKKIVVIGFILIVSSIFAQRKELPLSFNTFNYGIYGGVNFETASEIGGLFLLETKTNLTPKIDIKLSIGYSNLFILTSYNVKTNRKITRPNTVYQAITYDTYKKGFDLLPIFLGLQYSFKNQMFSPYLLLEVGYNFITRTRLYNTPQHVWTYKTFYELPKEYKTKHIEKFVANSYGVSIGAGTSYHISKNINLDFRYYYKYDSDIINTHNFIIGIYW